MSMWADSPDDYYGTDGDEGDVEPDYEADEADRLAGREHDAEEP